LLDRKRRDVTNGFQTGIKHEQRMEITAVVDI
jgi:hypothetical protein